MRIVSWLAVAVAFGWLALTAIPSNLWHAPKADEVYRGFDPNLMYSAPGGQISTDRVDLESSSPRRAESVVTLLTTPMQRFNVGFDAAISRDSSTGIPLRVGIWTPETGSGYFVTFRAGGIALQEVANGAVGATLDGGDVTAEQRLGIYSLGAKYRLRYEIERPNRISVLVSGQGLQAQAAITPKDLPGLFSAVRLSFTASANSQSDSVGNTQALLSNYDVTLLHERFFASKVDDPAVHSMQVLLVVLSVFLLLVSLVLKGRTATVQGGSKTSSRHSRLRVPWLIFGLGAAVYLVANVALFSLGGHPFDFADERVYAYVARLSGPAQLYYVPNLSPLAAVWGGIPHSEAGFPYEPTMAYVSAAEGWIQSITFFGGGAIHLPDLRLDYVIKSVNALFGLGDAVLIWLVLGQLRVPSRWQLIATALFAFNPAVWFSMSVWGQTHVISMFFILATIFFIEKRLPLVAWIALATGTLTRPQMLVFGFLLAIVLLVRFSWRESLVAVSWTVIIASLAILPITFVTSPSLPVDVMLNNLRIQEAGGNSANLTTVSQGAFSIWPLVTYATNGASGLLRAFTPSSTVLVGHVTYQLAGQVLTVLALSAAGLATWARSRSPEPGAYVPTVTIGIMLFLMLLTGVVSTHFLLALPVLILCTRWLDQPGYLYVIAIWTTTTVVPMYGDMGNVIAYTGATYPLLAPSHNGLTRVFTFLYGWDRFITVGVVANICAVLWLILATLRSSARTRTPPATAAT